MFSHFFSGTILQLDPTTTLEIVVLGAILLVLLEVVVGRGFFIVSQGEVGVLTKKFGGKKMPEGQIIARRGEIGTQARTLMPGLYFRFPVVWSVKKFPIVIIGADQVGVTESFDGKPLPRGRLLGDDIECNYFQDAEAFLDGGGFKGPQIGTLPPGKFRINPILFNVMTKPATIIPPDSMAEVTSQDGEPLPSDLIVAPAPFISRSDVYPKARDHKYFQDGQAFIDSGGFRGPQLDTLQPGKYYLNTYLFLVDIHKKFEVPPGFVAVLRSNVGTELKKKPGPEPAKVEAQPGRTTTSSGGIR